MAQNVERIEVDAKELASIADRTRGVLTDAEYKTLRSALETLAFLTDLLSNHKATLRRMRDLLFGSKTEKTTAVLEQAKPEAPPAQSPATPHNPEQKTKAQGHGRNGAEAYPGAPRERIAHPSLKPKDRCLECPKGRVYLVPPSLVVRVRGQAPLSVTVLELGRLRCNLCGAVFTAPEPGDAQAQKKYDATAGSMIALLKYGSGMPFNRLDKLQESLDAPLPRSTQWEIVRDVDKTCATAHEELMRQGANGDVVHNDDTGMKILALMKEQREREARNDPLSRTGVYTSGIVSTAEGRRIALFFTGRKHAGENLADVLARRTAPQPPIQMCDGLSRNLPNEIKTILSNCLAHGRRQFVELVEDYPEEVTHLLTEIGTVYKIEGEAKALKLAPRERLSFHKEQSKPVMDGLKLWLDGLIAERLVEPNSSLGKAIQYMRKRWDKMTLFLRVAGAPLDNNLCERVLKKAIMNRKNAYFYKSERGAQVGDRLMSLIATCQLNQANPFDYLTVLQRNAPELQRDPACWMPWNYKAALATAVQG
jgi:transposase